MKTKDKLIVFGGTLVSAIVGITVMWWVWTGILYLVAVI
jgi:hypothetical protein